MLGRADAPLVLDVRRDERFRESERMLPGALRCAPQDVPALRIRHPPRPGHRLLRAWPRGRASRPLPICAPRAGTPCTCRAASKAWSSARLPTLRKRPDLGVTGEQPSRWITRERPKIDRIACPWLVRRFIDPARGILLCADGAGVRRSQAAAGAVAYDIPGAPIAHDGELCSFDTLLRAFDLQDPALLALARIVRGADTDRLDLAPQSAGLLAISLGLSRLHADDHAMLEAALPLYDALYAWCRGGAGRSRTAGTPT